MANEINIKDELTDFLLYTTPNGEVKVDVFLHNEDIWLTQEKMAELFWKAKSTINEHLHNIYTEKELVETETMKKFGNPEFAKKPTQYYNLDLIIAVGYRTNSAQATQFRIWATRILKEYIIKWFVMDDDRLKNWKYFGKDYFIELLERVHSIRTSERRIYQQITDIFSECTIDYDKNSDITKSFYSMIQNKFHFAITGHTAAEIIYTKADKEEPFMWLNTWKNAPKGRIIKSDTNVAKNYLPEIDIKKLERTISGYFDYIERLIETRTTFTMEQLASSVNKFLEFNEYEILEGKGSRSRKQAEKKAFAEYDIFNKTQHIKSDFDKLVKSLVDKK